MTNSKVMFGLLIYVLITCAFYAGTQWKSFKLSSFTEIDCKNPSEKDIRNQASFFDTQRLSRQKQNSGNSGLPTLHYSILPEILCPTMIRMGDVGDGGKWVCNPWRLFSSTCVIYSLGVGGNPSFENDILNISKGSCEIHSFDPDKNYASLFKNKKNTHFHPWKMTNMTDWNTNKVTINDVMHKLGHSKIDVLKIDIEGGEYSTLPTLMRPSDVAPYFCQLQVEVHDFRGSEPWATLLSKMHASGYLMFAKEVNAHCGANCVEYAYVHHSCRAQLGLSHNVIHHNFACPNGSKSWCSP